MPLSQERKELLRKNRGKIAAFHKSRGEYSGTECRYKYDNGLICAASACLTNEERDLVVKYDRNTSFATSLNTSVDVNGKEYKACNINFSESDLVIIQSLQDEHDDYMRGIIIIDEFTKKIDAILA